MIPSFVTAGRERSRKERREGEREKGGNEREVWRQKEEVNYVKLCSFSLPPIQNNGQNNGLSLTCVPEAAKVADCAAYVAYYNVDTDVYCTRCTTGKAIVYGDDRTVSCVATADCER